MSTCTLNCPRQVSHLTLARGAPTRLVLNDDRLAQMVLSGAGKCTQRDVIWAARGKGYNQRHRSRWISLRLGPGAAENRSSHQNNCDGTRGQMKLSAVAGNFHGAALGDTGERHATDRVPRPSVRTIYRLLARRRHRRCPGEFGTSRWRLSEKLHRFAARPKGGGSWYSWLRSDAGSRSRPNGCNATHRRAPPWAQQRSA
jgi:hypothetical protein